MPTMEALIKVSVLFVASLGCTVAFAAACTGTESTSEWSIRPIASLSTPRAAHQTTVVSPDLALVTGGYSGTGCTPVERSAELLQVQTGHREIVSMNEARVAHVAALLSDGNVMVAGGWTGDRATASAEIFDSRTRTFSSVEAMATPRMDAIATPLLDGTILVTGGASATNRPLPEAEIFDHTEGRFIASGLMQEARAHHTAVRLQDGRVLVIGGQSGRNLATNSAEIYEPATRTFTATGSMQHPRCKHGAVLLADGRVMVIAGSSDCNERHRIAQTEIYDPRTERFTDGPPLLNPRYKIVEAATVLPSGEVIVAGNANDVEIWTPGTPAFIEAGEGLGTSLAFSTATPLPDGGVLVLGGYDNDIRVTAQAWIVSRTKSKDGPN